MMRAPNFRMSPRWRLPVQRFACLIGCFAAFVSLPADAGEKGGMPDLCQDEQTCLPTSTANLIVWFGLHGYPKLIADGDSEQDGYIHTIHRIMADTDANFDWGTRQEAVTTGITKYIRDAGYDCTVEYRGMDWQKAENADKAAHGFPIDPEAQPPTPFTQDWLNDNDDPNKGFVLLLSYVTYNPQSGVFSNALNEGHAVTLVNAMPDMILIHDPAHEEDEIGRKILTPQKLDGGIYQLGPIAAPVSGLLLLSGSLLGAPPNSGVMLTGAVCITMHPAGELVKTAPAQATGPNATIGGTGSGTTSAPSKTAPASTSWAMWLFDLLFKS